MLSSFMRKLAITSSMLITLLNYQSVPFWYQSAIQRIFKKLLENEYYEKLLMDFKVFYAPKSSYF